MEGSFDAPWLCVVHRGEISGFAGNLLRSAPEAVARLAESEPILRAILQATDACPECRRRAGPGPRHVHLSSDAAGGLWPDGFLNVHCVRDRDGHWLCTYEGGVKRKVLLLGDASARKTDLVRPAVHDQLADSVRDFLGAKVLCRHQTVRVAQEGLDFHVTFTIWDVAGRRTANKRRLRAYFYGAKTVLAVCDLSERTSVEELGYWLSVAKRVLRKPSIIILARETREPDPSGITEALLADLVSRHAATVLRIARADPHAVEHLFEGLGDRAVREVFGTSRWPRMYN